MNETIKTILQRRSIRKYSSKEIDDEVLNEILKCGTYAPSGKNRQSAVIVLIKDKKTRDLISKLNTKILNSLSDPYYNAPYIIIVLADKRVNTYIEDGSCCLENMMLGAESLGLGTCWIHRAREMFETDEGKELLAKWGLDASLEGIGSLALGYKDESKNAYPRKENYIKVIE